LKELSALLHLDEPTCNGRSVGENVAKAVNRNSEVIRPLNRPFRPVGGIAILKGNLAPDGGIAKPAAVATKMLRHTGPAQVFDGEVGYNGQVRVDHVPAMAGEENGVPGYGQMGRLFAIGYLKGLLEGVGY
jgi:dihydroxyacid dehydratase/phosphogluconate dehydratase